MSSRSKVKNSQTLISDNSVVLSKPITDARQLAKLRLHLQDIIQSVLNASDSNVNNFSDADVAKLLDAMTKSVYDIQDRGIVDAASERIITTLKASPGTINPGEAVFVTIGGAELVDNTFLTGVCDGIALDPITDLLPGRVLSNGLYLGDTSAWAPLDPLWLGPVPGLLTNVPPVAGEKNQLIGLVLVSDPINGLVQINPSDIRNTDADFSIYNPTTNIFITAIDVQAALDQVEAAFAQASIYHYAEDEVSTIEAASIWTNKVSLNIANLPAGDYEWQWSAEVNCTAVNRKVQVQVLENAVIVNEQEIEPKDTANWYPVTAFKKYIHPAPGPFFLDMEFRRSANPGAAACRRARIRLKSL